MNGDQRPETSKRVVLTGVERVVLDNIKSRVAERGLKQTQLEELIGFSRQSINNVFVEREHLSRRMREAFAAYFGVSSDEFYLVPPARLQCGHVSDAARSLIDSYNEYMVSIGSHAQ